MQNLVISIEYPDQDRKRMEELLAQVLEKIRAFEVVGGEGVDGDRYDFMVTSDSEIEEDE